METTVQIRIKNRPHPKQYEILQGARRFNHIRCGRRFGKTELINYIVSKNIDKKIGIWFPTYKDLHKVWDVIKYQYHDITRVKSETLHSISLWTAGEIDFWSLEDPNSGRGFDYDVVIIDEAAKAKKLKEAWKQTIRPTLTDRKGEAWIFSTPKGTTNYFYELDIETRHFDNWARFHFTTYDNPFIDPQEIEEAKGQTDTLTFQQEYLGEYVDLNNQPFLWSFKEKECVEDVTLNENLPIWLSFDFNKDPMTCIAAQKTGEREIVIEREFKLSNGSTPEMCDIISASFPGWLFYVTGDATGGNRSPLVRGNLNHFKYIKRYFRLTQPQIKVRNNNMDLLDSRLLCNMVLLNSTVKIDPSCKVLLQQMIYAKVDEYGKLIKDREDNKNDLLDCFRYLCASIYPNYIKQISFNDRTFDLQLPTDNGYPYPVLQTNGNGSGKRAH